MKILHRAAALFLTLLMLCQLFPAAALATGSAEYQAPSAFHSVTFGDKTYLVEDGYTISEFPEPPAEEGRAFLGWYDGDTLVTAPFTPTKDVRLTAKFEEINLSEQTLVASADDGSLISLTGVLPEGCVLTVTDEAESPYRRLLMKSRGGPDLSEMKLYTYNIQLTSAAGQEYQPEGGPVTVTVQGRKFTDALATGRSIRLVHEVDENNKEEITGLQVSGNTVSFQVSHFSRFIFTGVYDLVDWGSSLATDSGVGVSLSGVMPNGATAAALSAAPAVEEGAVLAAADITLYNSDVKVQPSAWGGELTVTLTSQTIADARQAGSELHVVHIDDEGYQTMLDDALLSFADNSVTFPADQFSVYAVVAENTIKPEARAAVNFYGKDQEHPLTTVYVKNSDDLAQTELIIYDPGAGQLANNDLFRGWKISTVNTTDAKIYTLADEPNAMTIEDVQQFFADFSETGDKRIAEGDVYNIYAMIYQAYDVEFRDEEGVVVFSETKLTLHDQPVDYTINVNYTPKGQNQQFLGWKVAGGYENNVAPKEGLEEEGLYPNQTEVEISGHAIFLPYAPEGRWLVFHENGKGATYCAPQFVKNGDVTKKPFEDEDMTRKGYTFAGWYTGAPAEGSEEPTGSLFEFGHVLNEETHLYAKWTPNTDAPYTVIFWTQNQARNGYDLKASYPGTGTVRQNIPYTFVNNGDEDYVTVTGTNEGHYTGFCLKPESANQQIVITPEGDAVLNLYYDRIQYELRFIYYRERNSNNNRYSYATGSNDGKNLWDIADWSGNGNTRPTQSYGEEKTVRINDSTGDYTAHYFILTAYYGDDISSQWPTYDKLGDAGGSAPVSFVMMNGTGLKGNSVNDNGYGDGRDTVKGIITRMDEQILAYTNDDDGNYLIIRYAGYNDWHYHLYFETIDGQSYPTDTNPQHPSPKTLQLNNKTYYYDRTVTSRSSNVSPDMQNPPSFAGFEVVKKAGSNVDEYYDNTGNHASNSNPYQTGYHGDDGPYLSYYYNRLAYPVTYMDGVYVDKDNEPITSHTDQELHRTEDIPYEASTAGCASYVPQITDTLEREGYVFEGWYADAACRTPMVWTTMPIGGIRVYAKWRQIQYRVFLHPNAGNAASDPGLDWGSEGVSTSFRVEYGQKVSTPYGRGRPEYEFVGWYWDAAFTRPYNSENTILNNGTITSSSAFTYSKTEPTELDKWGNPGTDTSNHDVDRFWVTRKLDLYAKWRLKIEGARGIRVVYTADESETVTGTNAPTDPLYYLDEAGAIGGAASTPDDEKLQFLHWVVQKWDENSQKFVDTRQIVYPAGTFIVYKRDTRKEDNPDYTVGGSEDEFIYTIQLRPQYGPKDAPTPTHLTWYDNFTENPVVNTNYFTDNDLQINEAVPIKPAATFIRPGYKFLGWARVPTTDNSGTQIPGYSLSPKELDEDDLFLTYHENTNTFTAVVSGEETTVTKVAADEKFPYHDLYAVWKRWVPTIYYVMLTDGTQAVTEITNFKYYNYNTQATGLGIGNVSPPVQGMEIATPAAWNFVNTPIQLSRNNPPTGNNSFSAPEAFDSQIYPADTTKYGSVRFVNMGVATLGANGTLTYPTVRSSVLYMRFMEDVSTNTCYYEYSTDNSVWTRFTEDMVLYAIYSESAKISVSKAWKNMNNGVVVNTNAPTGATVTFKLYQRVGTGETEATAYTVTLDGTTDTVVPTTIGGYESEPWKATFVELPVVDTYGTFITYSVAETTGYAGYEASTTDPVTDGGTITNTQKRDTLTVSKTVSGNMSEMTKEFSFVLSVTGNYVNPNLTATKTAADGTTSSVSFTLTQSGSAYTRSFTLKHGESLLIPDLPDQADVTISETAAPYTPYYRVNSAETETQGSSCTFTLTGETAVFFRNNLSQIPDTGVHMDTIPYLLILALCALGLEALRRRRVKGGM